MSATPQTLALITLALNYRGEIVKQTNRAAVTLRVIPIVEGGGQAVTFVPEGSGIVAEMYSEGAAVTNYGSDVQGKGLLSWASGRANFSVTGLAQAAAATSGTPTGNVRIWARNMANGASALASLINQEVHSGDGTGTHLTGLAVAIGSASNTYASIDRSNSANAYFRPNVWSTAAPLSFDLIRGDLAAIYVASGRRPDVAIAHPNVIRKIKALSDPLKHLFIPTTPEVVTARGSVILDPGAGVVFFEGCAFIEDKDAVDGTIAYLSTEHVRLEYLPLDLSTVPGLEDEIADVVADDGLGMVPLGMRLEMLARTGDADNAMMKSYVQLVVDRPNACGYRSNIA